VSDSARQEEADTFTLVRAATYATFFIGLVLVFGPARVLAWAGLAGPAVIGLPQVAGMLVAAAGAGLAVWCVLAFALIGRGTPAPFDPPRRLVVAGPYRAVRNPMYLGATLALAGAALFYGSYALLAYAAIFLLLTHVFVVSYEEPTLRRAFGQEYEAYCRRVRRWRPTLVRREDAIR
jgi:protein-S-isoprenylcysteine O-methyltransferase Ste14